MDDDYMEIDISLEKKYMDVRILLEIITWKMTETEFEIGNGKSSRGLTRSSVHIQPLMAFGMPYGGRPG